MAESRLLEVERRSIEPIPANERFGNARGLYGIWFGINMLPLALVTGGLAIGYGLSFGWSFIAFLIGNLVGGLAMGLHAAQGPRLGVPQMLQARGQFGFRGGSLLAVLALIVMVGFFASNLVAAASALTSAVSQVPLNVGIIVAFLTSLTITMFGYRLIRVTAAASSVLVGGLVIIAVIAIISRGEVTHEVVTSGGFDATAFGSIVAVAAVWQIAYGPYVSDYSRYLPADTGGRGAFWGTYLGTVSGAVLLMTVGAFAAIGVKGSDGIGGLEDKLGTSLGEVVLIGMFIAGAVVNTVNTYTGTLCTLTMLETFKGGWVPTLWQRLGVLIGLHAIGLGIALAGSDDFLTNFLNFLTLLLYVLIPWSAINLADFYLVRHGNYDVSAFYQADGGEYGQWNGFALSIYAIGVLVQIPFMSTVLYTGSWAKAMNGLDIAWIVGFVVAGVLYLALVKRFGPPTHKTIGAVAIQPVADQ